MSKNKLISIIVPVFNVEQYLERCLQSLVNQTYKNIEIILINDGSTDSSPLICKNYAESDNRIKYINKKNEGVSIARNLGLDVAKGEYILFVDSDDYLNINLISNITEDINNSYDIIVFQHSINNSLEYSYLNISDYYTCSGEDMLLLLYEKNKQFNVVWKYCYNRNFLKRNKIKFHEYILHEDEEWIPIVFIKARKVIFRNIIGYYYIIRPNSIITTQNIYKNISLIKVALSLSDFVKNNNFKNNNIKKILKKKIVSLYIKNSILLLNNNCNEDIVLNNINLLKNCTSIKHFIYSLYLLTKIIIYKI